MFSGLQTRPNSHLPVREAPKDQNRHVQIRAPKPSSVSSEQEQTYINSHSLVEDTPAEDLLAAGGANSGRFGARWYVPVFLQHARGWSISSAYSMAWTCHWRNLGWLALSGMALGATPKSLQYCRIRLWTLKIQSLKNSGPNHSVSWLDSPPFSGTVGENGIRVNLPMVSVNRISTARRTLFFHASRWAFSTLKLKGKEFGP